MNRIKITICGTEYKIASDEPASYVMDIARKTDKDIRDLMSKNDRLSLNMAAVLTAINNADAAFKAEADADNLRIQLKRALDENAELRQKVSTGQLQF